jgi:hypothetical protein
LASLPTLTSLTTLDSLSPLSLSVRHNGLRLWKEMEWQGRKKRECHVANARETDVRYGMIGTRKFQDSKEGNRV